MALKYCMSVQVIYILYILAHIDALSKRVKSLNVDMALSSKVIWIMYKKSMLKKYLNAQKDASWYCMLSWQAGTMCVNTRMRQKEWECDRLRERVIQCEKEWESGWETNWGREKEREIFLSKTHRLLEPTLSECMNLPFFLWWHRAALSLDMSNSMNSTRLPLCTRSPLNSLFCVQPPPFPGFNWTYIYYFDL